MTNQSTFEQDCREHLERFFARHPGAVSSTLVMAALRRIASSEKPPAGKPEGWAAGLLYAEANLYRQACGVPGILNAELEAFFGVSMSTVRARAARVSGEFIP